MADYSGVYLNYEGTDSECNAVQLQRELTWATDIGESGAIRYKDCNGDVHYMGPGIGQFFTNEVYDTSGQWITSTGIFYNTETDYFKHIRLGPPNSNKGIGLFYLDQVVDAYWGPYGGTVDQNSPPGFLLVGDEQGDGMIGGRTVWLCGYQGTTIQSEEGTTTINSKYISMLGENFIVLNTSNVTVSAYNITFQSIQSYPEFTSKMYRSRFEDTYLNIEGNVLLSTTNSNPNTGVKLSVDSALSQNNKLVEIGDINHNVEYMILGTDPRYNECYVSGNPRLFLKASQEVKLVAPEYIFLTVDSQSVIYMENNWIALDAPNEISLYANNGIILSSPEITMDLETNNVEFLCSYYNPAVATTLINSQWHGYIAVNIGGNLGHIPIMISRIGLPSPS